MNLPPEPPVLSCPRDGLPVLVDTPQAYAAAVARLSDGDGPLAVDTERAQSFRYSSKAYLIQLRRAGAGTVLIDPVALEDGADRADLSSLARACICAEWLIHAATQDLPYLAEVGLRPQRLFDTELAGRLLGYPQVALGTLVERFCGVRLLKEQSATDWSARPLSVEQIAYAALDVELLADLRTVLGDELEAAGKAEWARQEFAALVEGAGPPGPPDPERWRHTHGLHAVAGRRGLAVVRELWSVRDGIARATDRAPGRVLPDAAMVEAAELVEHVAPGQRVKLGAIAGFHRRVARDYRDRWEEAVATASRLPAAALPPLRLPADGPPAPRGWQHSHPQAWDRWQAIRPATRALAASLEVPVENLVSPRALRALAWSPPAPADEAGVAAALAAAGARPWQCELVAPAVTPLLAPARA